MDIVYISMDKLSNKKMDKTAFLWALAIVVILPGYVTAARVGVFVEFPDGNTYSKCIDIEGSKNAYDIIQKTDLNISWSPPSQWGHGLCMIDTVGCPSDNCYCSSSYWNFYIKKLNENSWSYSPVGFDGGSGCWNGDYNSFDGNYCANDGDVLGLSYGGYGTIPRTVEIESICRISKASERERNSLLISISPERIYAEEFITIRVLDNRTLDPIKDAEIIIYPRDSDASLKIFNGFTNKNGIVSLSINKSGNYKTLVAASGYPHKYLDLNVANKKRVEENLTRIESTSTIELTSTSTESTSTINIEEIKEEINKLEELKSEKTDEVENNGTEGGIEITGHAVNVKPTEEGVFWRYWALLPIVIIVVPFLLWVRKW